MRNKKDISASGCLSEELLFAYMQNRASGAEKKRVEAHIRECELCSDALEGLSSSGTADHRKRIRHIEEQINARSARSVLNDKYMWMAAASVLFLMIGGAIWYLSIETAHKERQLSEAPVSTGAEVSESPADTSPVRKDVIPKEKTEASQPRSRAVSQEPPVMSEHLTSAPASDTRVSGEADALTPGTLSDEKASEDRNTPLSANSAVVIEEKPHDTQEARGQMLAVAESLIGEKVQDVKNYSRKDKSEMRDTEIKRETQKAIPQALMSGPVQDGQFYYQRKQYAKAEQLFTESLEAGAGDSSQLSVTAKGSGNLNTLSYRALTRIHLKKYEEALNDAEMLSVKDPELGEWIKALILIEKGEKQRARRLLERLSKGEGRLKTKAWEVLSVL